MPPPSASAIVADAAAADAPLATAASGRVPVAEFPPAPRDAGVARRPLRLLLLTDTAITVAGGSERFLRNLAALLPRERYRITLVQLLDTRYTGTRVVVGSDLDHVELVELPVAAVYGRKGWHALRTLRALLRSGRFDVVQSQHETADLLNALLPTAPGRLRVSCRRDMGFGKSARLKRLFRHLNHRFDAVLAPSQAILDDLVQGEAVDPSRTGYIANGVDTGRFAPLDPPARRAVRRELGLADDDVAYVCVARLCAEKCHGDLLQAFAAVHAGDPRTRLFLVGDGPLQAEVEARCARPDLTGAVTLLGLRLDVDRLLPAFDAGVLASSTEGMSNAILEAMACGLPVVATDVGGNPVLVEHGVTGLLVPARHPGRLGAALASVASEPARRQRMGRAARAHIERAFSVQAMVAAFDDTYHRLLDPR